MWSWPELAPGVRSVGATPGTAPRAWTPGALAPADGEPRPAASPAPPDLDALEREWAARVEAARREGFAAGERAGREAAGREDAGRIGAALAALEAAASACVEDRQRWSRTLEENMTALAMAVARHLVEHHVQEDPALVSQLVRRGLGAFPPDQRVRIRLNPEDLSALTARGPEGQAVAPRGREVEWVADATIHRGGCMVEGPESVVDGRVDTALERLYWRLVE